MFTTINMFMVKFRQSILLRYQSCREKSAREQELSTYKGNGMQRYLRYQPRRRYELFSRRLKRD